MHIVRNCLLLSTIYTDWHTSWKKKSRNMSQRGSLNVQHRCKCSLFKMPGSEYLGSSRLCNICKDITRHFGYSNLTKKNDLCLMQTPLPVSRSYKRTTPNLVKSRWFLKLNLSKTHSWVCLILLITFTHESSLNFSYGQTRTCTSASQGLNYNIYRWGRSGKAEKVV